MNIGAWMINLVQTHGYLGAFLVSIIGNVTIIFPVPYVAAIYYYGATLNPLALGLVAGAGAAVGEISAYLLGYGGRRTLNETQKNKLKRVEKLLRRHGALTIFLFSALPLPTDLIMVPLGAIKYSLRKALAVMFIGKSLMCASVAYAGRHSYTRVLEVFTAPRGPIIVILGIAIALIVLNGLLKIDWIKHLETRLT